MEQLLEMLRNVSNTEIFAQGSSIWVDVTYIHNPHRFYVRPTRYRQHLPALEAHGSQVNMKNIFQGSRVIFKSKIAEHTVRGLVFTIQNSVCDIFAIDYGFLEKKVKPESIFLPLTDDLLPPLATLCKLGACYPLGGEDVFSEDATDAMNECLGKNRAKVIVKIKTPEILVVQLLNSMPEDVAHLLALTGFTTVLARDH